MVAEVGRQKQGGAPSRDIALFCSKLLKSDVVAVAEEAFASTCLGRFRKSDDALQIVWAEVLVPDVPDTDGDVISAVEIRKAATSFAQRLKLKSVDVQHDNRLVKGAAVVESFIARDNDPNFIPGSWVVGVHVPDKTLWSKIVKGELNSFSMDALGYQTPDEIEIDLPLALEGDTQARDGHTHKFLVKFDENGKFVGGRTTVDNGHSHKIEYGTITEPSDDGHTHRYSMVELLRVHAS